MKLIPKLLVVALGLGCLLTGPLRSLSPAADRPDLPPAPALALSAQPQRVVSLIPTVTEIIRALDAAERLVGLTVHDLPATAGDDPRIVGDFFSPSPELIAARRPDLIIISNLHRGVEEHFAGRVPLLNLRAGSLEQAFSHIELLGRLLGRPQQAAALIADHQNQLERVAADLEMVPQARRPRTIRLMGTEPLAAPGDDSFQNDYIRAAGGTPPTFGRNGDIIALNIEELAAFDPQVIYVCGTGGAERILNNQALGGLAAVREGRVLSFHCDLTCRTGVDIGLFVTQLAGGIYPTMPPATEGER